MKYYSPHIRDSFRWELCVNDAVDYIINNCTDSVKYLNSKQFLHHTTHINSAKCCSYKFKASLSLASFFFLLMFCNNFFHLKNFPSHVHNQLHLLANMVTAWCSMLIDIQIKSYAVSVEVTVIMVNGSCAPAWN